MEQKKWFDSKMPFVIAVNTGDLPHPDNSRMPKVLQALFGFDTMKFNVKTVEIYFSCRDQVKKSETANIPVNYFVNENLSFVSGVLFSDKNFANYPENIGEDCIFVNNPFADNKVEESFIKLFKNWSAEKNNEEIILKKNYD